MGDPILRLFSDHLLLLAIRAGALSVVEADAALQVLASHRFKIKFRSFRDLLEEPRD